MKSGSTASCPTAAPAAKARSSTDRVRAFRGRNKRIDFYPSNDVLLLLGELREALPALSDAAILDEAVRALHLAHFRKRLVVPAC